MTISNSIFGHSSDIGDWLCEYWRPEHCVPTNWKAPKTEGIEGVWLVGPNGELYTDDDPWEERIKALFMGQIPISNNPVRAQQTTIARINHYASIFKDPDRGVLLNQDPLYYDIEAKDLSGGNGRGGAGIKLKFPGYMMARVKYATQEAKIRHAMKSQPRNDRSTFATIMSKEDVKTGVIALVEVTGHYKMDDVMAECDDAGKDLVDVDLTWVKREVKKELEKDGTIPCTDNYQEFNNDLYKPFLNQNPDDPWVKNIFNDDALVQYINLADKTLANYYRPLIRKVALALAEDRPLHLLVNFPIPTGKSKVSLEGLRDAFFSKDIKQYEDEHIKVFMKQYVNMDLRTMFPWNRPDAENMCLAQDRVAESDKVVVRLRNRKYN